MLADAFYSNQNVNGAGPTTIKQACSHAYDRTPILSHMVARTREKSTTHEMDAGRKGIRRKWGSNVNRWKIGKVNGQMKNNFWIKCATVVKILEMVDGTVNQLMLSRRTSHSLKMKMQSFSVCPSRNSQEIRSQPPFSSFSRTTYAAIQMSYRPWPLILHFCFIWSSHPLEFIHNIQIIKLFSIHLLWCVSAPVCLNCFMNLSSPRRNLTQFSIFFSLFFFPFHLQVSYILHSIHNGDDHPSFIWYAKQAKPIG